MSRKATIRIVFGVLGALWFAYFVVDLFASVYGDCSDAFCEGRHSIEPIAAFWRGLAIGLMLWIGYLYVRRASGE